MPSAKQVFNVASIVLIALILATAVSLTSYIHADSINPGVFSIDSKPYGLGYPDWTAKWWQWLFSTSKEKNPINDPTGQNCSVNQNDQNVWYLAQTFRGSAERNCIIPAGKAVLIPILRGECDYLSDTLIKDESELRKCAWSGIAGAVIKLSIDGVDFKSLEKYRIRSPLFNLTIPADNAFGGGGPVGATQAVADGYYVLLEPLTRGKHKIHFSSSILDNPSLGTYAYAEDVKYNIEVKS